MRNRSENPPVFREIVTDSPALLRHAPKKNLAITDEIYIENRN
jgi:hypothetical protein